MVEWFYQNYEDPANKTPYDSAEGGYQYIFEGPYRASDEIGCPDLCAVFDIGKRLAQTIIPMQPMNAAADELCRTEIARLTDAIERRPLPYSATA